MKSTLFILILLIAFSPYSSRGQDSLKKDQQLDYQKFVVLTSKDLGQPIQLNKSDLILIEQIIQVCIDTHNSQYDSTSYHFLKLENYARQYVAYLSGKEKTVWVNCFCKEYIKRFDFWRKEPVIDLMEGAVSLV